MDLGAEKVRAPSAKSPVPKGMADGGGLLLEASMAPQCSLFQYEGRCDGWGGRKFFYLLTNTWALSKFSNLQAPANPLINDSLILASQKSMVTMN